MGLKRIRVEDSRTGDVSTRRAKERRTKKEPKIVVSIATTSETSFENSACTCSSASAASATTSSKGVVKEGEVFRASFSELKRRLQGQIEKQVDMANNAAMEPWGRYVGSDSDLSKFSFSRTLFSSGSSSSSSAADSFGKWSEHCEGGEGRVMRFGAARMRGVRRTQQDAFVVVPDYRIKKSRGAFLGVFDGHGTEKVAQLCEERLPELIRKNCRDTSYRSLRRGIMKGYSSLAHEASKAAFEGEGQRASTTATVAIIAHDTVVVGNVGNSRALLCVDGRAVRLTEDTDSAPLRTPNVYRHSLKHASFLVLVSDGVVDVMSDDELVELVAKKVARDVDLETMCLTLLELSFTLGSLDNMTVVVAVFKR